MISCSTDFPYCYFSMTSGIILAPAPSTFDSALSQSLTQREHFHLPLTQDLPEHLEFFFVVTLHNQHYVFSHHKVGVLVLE